MLLDDELTRLELDDDTLLGLDELLAVLLTGEDEELIALEELLVAEQTAPLTLGRSAAPPFLLT
jgi:hypothetical protein